MLFCLFQFHLSQECVQVIPTGSGKVVCMGTYFGLTLSNTVADDIPFFFLIIFVEKITLGILCELSTSHQTIHMKFQALSKCCLLLV